MADSENGRPAKKAKLDVHDGNTETKSKSKQPARWRTQQQAFKRERRRDELNHPQPESAQHRRDRELFGIDEDNKEETSLKPLQDEKREKLRKLHFPKMFSQPSVMATGDKGIFVTCDKGKEKKCLSELADLVEDYLEQQDIIPPELLDPDALVQSRLDRQQKKSATIAVDNEESPVEEEEIDIESSINAELTGMHSPHQGGQDSHPAKGAPLKVRAFQLITLDVPCVSFLRFIPNGPVYEKVDVVDLVHSICAEAARNPGRMRSRHIRRLSPISWLGKVLSGGLDKACEESLPAHFKLEGEFSVESADEGKGKNGPSFAGQGSTFAVRPTIRNNDKVSRDDIIKEVAQEVQRLGNSQHKVDLKGYQKGILVEVYRGWVGLSVVDNTNSASSKDGMAIGDADREFGYEALKRFNLAEIYAESFKKVDEGQ